MKRRTFLESTFASAVVASLPSRAFATMHQINKVGVQLYTVRDAMKADFNGTIAKVAGIGYKELEFAGYFGNSPKDIRALLDTHGLTAPSCHFGYDIVEKHWPETIESAQIIGHQFIVCPMIPGPARKSADGWKSVIELFNKAGEASKKAGIQFGYHNHYWEFAPDTALGGKLPYDYLLENLDANLVKMEMDIGWIGVAGQDPATYFKRYPGRFPLVHVKDFKKLPHMSPEELAHFNAKKLEEEEMTEAGHGELDWKRIFSSADQAGIQHFFVEHDSPKDAFASLTASYQYLSALRF